jgi:hypothetical protein
MKPSLERSLPYAALQHRHRWLGDASPRSLDHFLTGAAWRVDISGAEVPTWRVYGPLRAPEFLAVIDARTGHRSSRSMGWAFAMEMGYLSHEDAAHELLELMRAFVLKHGLDDTPLAKPKRVVTFERLPSDRVEVARARGGEAPIPPPCR